MAAQGGFERTNGLIILLYTCNNAHCDSHTVDLLATEALVHEPGEDFVYGLQFDVPACLSIYSTIAMARRDQMV